MASDIYVNGQKIEAKAGTYENAIVVPADADCVEAVDMVADIKATTTPGIVPADRTELVANTDMGMGRFRRGFLKVASFSSKSVIKNLPHLMKRTRNGQVFTVLH